MRNKPRNELKNVNLKLKLLKSKLGKSEIDLKNLSLLCLNLDFMCVFDF